MKVYVNLLIYLYLFICLSLLLFNFGYIVFSKYRIYIRNKKKKIWIEDIKKQILLIEKGKNIKEDHKKQIQKKLKKIENLIVYNSCLEEIIKEENFKIYLSQISAEINSLAFYYSHRAPMERAFFSYIISEYCPISENKHNMLASILLTYLPNSTIYCRENVLKALYVLGNESAIEQAYAVMNQDRIYHPSRLLSDGLATFTGDKEALANRLWQACYNWEENYQVAVIQMISLSSSNFQDKFAKALESGKWGEEACFAMMRYFNKYPYEYLLPFLHSCVEKNDNLAIVATTVLAHHKDEETSRILIKGLHSRNWYIRRNSASALVASGHNQTLLEKLSDRYAREIYTYMLEEQNAKGGFKYA